MGLVLIFVPIVPVYPMSGKVQRIYFRKLRRGIPGSIKTATKKDTKVQDAHEAIRPSNISRTSRN